MKDEDAVCPALKGYCYKAAARLVGIGVVMEEKCKVVKVKEWTKEGLTVAGSSNQEECRKKDEVAVLRFAAMMTAEAGSLGMAVWVSLCQGKVGHTVVVERSDHPVHHLKKAVVVLVPTVH
jgi:hypothetical protein